MEMMIQSKMMGMFICILSLVFAVMASFADGAQVHHHNFVVMSVLFFSFLFSSLGGFSEL